jgi:hypothetical protein
MFRSNQNGREERLEESGCHPSSDYRQFSDKSDVQEQPEWSRRKTSKLVMK